MICQLRIKINKPKNVPHVRVNREILLNPAGEDKKSIVENI